MEKTFNKLYVIIMTAVMTVISVAFFWLPDKTYSENENRSLETAPELSADTVFSGDYTQNLGSYFSDQFPLRDSFVAVKAYSELVLGKRENNGVIYAGCDTLIPRPAVSEDRIDDNIKAISEFANFTSCEVTVVPVPRTVDVFSELLPECYPTEDDLAVWNKLHAATEAYGVNTVNIYDVLCESNAYYRTDHHYTTKGAYITYKALGERLGYLPFTEDDFSVTTVTSSFCGTSMRSSGFYMAEKDSIELYRYEGDGDYSILADGEKTELYDMDKLETADKYAVFLGGNHARVDITLEGENRERLLIIRDSFADSLVPFLSRHFDLTLIDLRYYSDNVASLTKTEKISKVLVLESITELSTAKNLSYLRMK